MKLRPIAAGGTLIGYAFFCPACKMAHPFRVPEWTFDGDMERPTFTPSLACAEPDPTDPERKRWRNFCHLFLTKGELRYCECPVEFANRRVPLPEWPEGDDWP